MRKRGNKGYAITMFLIIMLVMTMLTAALASTVTNSQKSSKYTAGRAEARLLAASMLESLYVEMLEKPVDFGGYVTSGTGFSAPGLGVWQRFEASTSTSTPSSTRTVDCEIGANTRDWYTYDCAKITKVSSSPRAVLFKVETRVDCQGVREQCVYAEFQQRMRRSQFYDYLYFNNSGSLDQTTINELGYPNTANCAGKSLSSMIDTDPCRGIVPAFIGVPSQRDIVNGAVYLRDDFLPVCGNPDFQKPVHIGGRGYRDATATTVQWWVSMEKWRNDLGCATSPPPPVTAAPQLLDFPKPDDLGMYVPGNAQPQNPCSVGVTLPTGSALAAAKQANNLICLEPSSPSAPVSIDFGAGSATISGSTANGSLAYAGAGNLIFVTGTGTVNIKGTVQGGQVTVMTAAEVRITGNLTHSTTADAIGIVADKRIIISEPASPGENRTIKAVLVSLNGAIVADRWFDSAQIGTLFFTGSLAGKYRTVVGGYVDGVQVAGFAKNFAWDQRFSENDSMLQYLPRPKGAGWTRLDLSEVRTEN